MTKKVKQPDIVQVTFYWNPARVELVEKMAKKERRSRSQQIITLLEKALKIGEAA